MSNRTFIVLCIWATCLVMMFVTSSAMAGADWKERQKQMFAQLPVKPGDVIDKSNWEKAKGLLPEPVLNWVKKGEWILKIGEYKYDFDFTPEWYELSKKNAGKYGLGSKNEVIELKTGKFPLFVRGKPFPDVDVKNDPEGATKLMHNYIVCGQMNGSFWASESQLQWIGRSGYERGFIAGAERIYYWNRPHGPIPNPNEYMFSIVMDVVRPYDMRGMSNVSIRHLDGRDDSLYAYVPAIRRVKRLSGANRSDPYMGGDSTNDDGNGFDGQIESMKWTYIDDKVMLCPRYVGDTERPRMYKLNTQGAWEHIIGDGQRIGWEEEGWTGASWAFTDAVWVPREVLIVKAEPLDPYYQYGDMYFHMDKLCMTMVYNVKYSRAQEYWKTMVQDLCMNVIPDPEYAPTAHAFNVYGPQVVVDDKIHHASLVPVDETLLEIDSPKSQPRNHTPQGLRMRSK